MMMSIENSETTASESFAEKMQASLKNLLEHPELIRAYLDELRPSWEASFWGGHHESDYYKSYFKLVERDDGIRDLLVPQPSSPPGISFSRIVNFDDDNIPLVVTGIMQDV